MIRAEILVRHGDDVVVDDTTETRYQLASVSKQFTAAAVLLLVEDDAAGDEHPPVVRERVGQEGRLTPPPASAIGATIQ